MAEKHFIRKVKYKDKYTLIPNATAQSPDLSNKAKGLLLTLMSLPEDWVIRKTQIVDFMEDAYRSMNTAFMELMTKGYIIELEQINVDGKFGEKGYLVYGMSVFHDDFFTYYEESPDDMIEKHSQNASTQLPSTQNAHTQTAHLQIKKEQRNIKQIKSKSSTHKNNDVSVGGNEKKENALLIIKNSNSTIENVPRGEVEIKQIKGHVIAMYCAKYKEHFDTTPHISGQDAGQIINGLKYFTAEMKRRKPEVTNYEVIEQFSVFLDIAMTLDWWHEHWAHSVIASKFNVIFNKVKQQFNAYNKKQREIKIQDEINNY